MDLRCRIEMFGGLQATQGEQTHTRFRTHKVALLLAYLALHKDQAQPRERLLDLLWPEMELATARLNLNTTLTQLRRQLEPVGMPAGSLLITDKQHVRLNPLAISTDVADFSDLLQIGRAEETGQRETGSNGPGDEGAQGVNGTERAARLEKAISLYRGSLLPGWYEEWVTAEQTLYQAAYQEALRELAERWEEAGRYSDALALAQKACQADPYDERGWLLQMRLLVRLRKPSLALQAYESLEQLFTRDLGARPSAKLRQMAEMIRTDPRSVLLLRAEAKAAARPAAEAGQSTVAPDAVATPSEPQMAATSSSATSNSDTSSPSPDTASRNATAAPPLPLQLTRFFGREAEREQVAGWLREPGVRLVSVLGPGGGGKTRLALEVAAQVAPHFAGRVWFAPLADIPDASLIVSTLLRTLRLPPSAGDPLDQVIACLSAAPSLLVLDNLEHLLREKPGAGKNDNPGVSGCVGLIRLLLERIPGLVCLVTSRQPLRLGGEQEFPLPPLACPCPDEEATPERLMANPSIGLYVDRARSVRPDFALTAGNAPAVSALCQRLEGMPLAIEMAAAWVKTLPPHKMLERLERQLDLLVSRRRDLPPRHQSLRATIEWSYDLLTPEQQAFFVRLGVFRGGWTMDAAEAVCGSDALHTLLALQEHSLIVAVEPEAAPHKATNGDEEAEPRYRMLEPLREFAQEKLEAGDAGAQTRNRHRDYLIRWMEREGYGRGSVANTERLHAEHDNLRAALEWCRITPEGAAAGLRLAHMARHFWHEFGYWQEGLKHLEAAIAHPGVSATNDWYRARLDADYFHVWLGHETDSEALLNECLDYFHAAGDREGIAECLMDKSDLAVKNGALVEAQRYLEEAVALRRNIKDAINLPMSLLILGTVTLKRGDRIAALAAFEEAHALDLAKGQRQGLAQCFIGYVYCLNGDYGRASHILCAALTAFVSGRKHYVIDALGYLAILAQAEGQRERAAHLFGAFSAQTEALMGDTFLWPKGGTFDTALATLKADMDAQAFSAAYAAGRAMSESQFVAYALHSPQN